MKYVILFLTIMSCELLAMDSSDHLDKSAVTIKTIAQQIAKRKEEKYEIFLHKIYTQAPFPKKIIDKGQFLLLRKLCVSSYFVPVLKDLLEKKLVDPNAKFKDRQRGCHVWTFRLISESAYHKAYENMEVLLQFGADPNKTAANFEGEYEWQESPLCTAVEAQDNRMLSLLLDKKADPNKKYEYCNDLPLFRAACNYGSDSVENAKRAHEVIAALLKHGASPDGRVQHGINASREDYTLNFESWVNGKICFTPRELATECNYTDILALFDTVKPE